MRRTVWIVIVVLLVGAPVLDLAWNEPTLDYRQGAYCQLHANPALTSEPVCFIVACTAERLLPFKPHDHLAVIGPSIFIPPRA